MAWNVDFNDTAKHQLAKLDRQWQAAILDYLEDRIAILDDPRSRGKPLVGDKKGVWRYRVGDYRILCELRDNELVVLVVTIGHRRQVYRDGNQSAVVFGGACGGHSDQPGACYANRPTTPEYQS